LFADKHQQRRMWPAVFTQQKRLKKLAAVTGDLPKEIAHGRPRRHVQALERATGGPAELGEVVDRDLHGRRSLFVGDNLDAAQ
jgi:hypothetical protein